jgi:alpha-glucosidase
VFARRSGDRWFIGGGFSGPARTASVPLNLGRGSWLVDLITDGPSGLVKSQQVLTNGAPLIVPITPNGGFAALATPYRP